MCLFLSLVWFYGISTIVGYLMPNPVYIYMICEHFVDTQLNDQTFLFLTVQFSISHLFAYILNVLFDS